MPTADARIPTDRASRYLAQFCRHLDQLSRMRHTARTGHGRPAPPAVRQVDWSDTEGTIHFGHGTCTLRAGADALTVRIDADDEDAMRQLQDGVTGRLEQIGRRDRLTVDWQGQAGEATPRRRGLRGVLVLAGLGALVLAVHLGLFGGALAASSWAGWGTIVVVVLVLVKVGVSVLLGRTAIRRHRRRH